MSKLDFLKKAEVATVPKAPSRMGEVTVIHPDAVYADPSLGPGIDLPELPDFAAMADEQCGVIADYGTFHETAIGFFAPKLDEEARRYCFELHGAFEQYASHLNTTYRSALQDELTRARSRLSSMPCVNERLFAKARTR